MAEAFIATFKSELVDGRRFPSFERAEHQVLHWIGFYNEERLHEALGDLPRAEYEQFEYQDRQHPNAVRQTQSLQRTASGVRAADGEAAHGG